jgi:hypothetical protein
VAQQGMSCPGWRVGDWGTYDSTVQWWAGNASSMGRYWNTPGMSVTVSG